MSKYTKEIEKRRTFAIISHPDAGKTTLTAELKECLLKIHRLSLMLCQLRFSDSLNKDYDENIHLPGLWLDTDGFKKERG